MALQIHNVRTRRKEPFAPRQPGRVGVYVCGLTVYDHAHIGHARTAVAFEVVRRWLEHRYPNQVRFVQNVTDVDDKILARAAERGVSPRAHAKEWDERCRRQMERLGVRPPDEAPHVTDAIPGIIRFTQGILANGFAYATPADNVYFDVPKYQAHAEGHLRDAEGRPCGYGSLSNRDYKEMAAGTRKDVEADKRNPADFALWKAAEPGSHPDASWDSPWGRGRPGWHIECSEMSTRTLGETIDIHGGGQDLVFPHHENEIAQSQAKTGKAPFVNVWMHTGFLNVEGEKMSKSLGNYITLESMLDELAAEGVRPDALRLYFLQTHYRSKIDFSRKGLQEAVKALARLERTRSLLAAAAKSGRPGEGAGNDRLRGAARDLAEAFAAAMDDDVHTPGALAALYDLQRIANEWLEGPKAASIGAGAALEALQALEAHGNALTLFEAPPVEVNVSVDVDVSVAIDLQATVQVRDSTPAELAAFIQREAQAGKEKQALDALVAARQQARAAKDWKRSDAIRDAAKAAGYLIEDTPAGQRWRRAG